MAATATTTAGSAMEHVLGKVQFKQTIPRQLTHKRRLENVYVTSLDRISNSEFICGAFVPLANMYLNEMRSRPGDVALAIIEIGRQAGIAVCHEFLGVAPGDAFILDDVGFSTGPGYANTDWSADNTLAIKMLVANTPNGELDRREALRSQSQCFINGECVCTLAVAGMIQTAERYQRLRKLMQARRLRGGKTQATPFEGIWLKTGLPAKRSVLGDVVWMSHGGNLFAATLQVDRGNQFFFDHENDHVPGMLILEGMRELAADVALRFSQPDPRTPGQARSSLLADDIDISFKNFAELDAPVQLIAEVDRTRLGLGMSIGVQARQGTELVAVSTVQVKKGESL
jgi:2-oxo-3-(phosphooxy)propyl 3-oxoalkanoate synthase